MSLNSDNSIQRFNVNKNLRDGDSIVVYNQSNPSYKALETYNNKIHPVANYLNNGNGINKEKRITYASKLRESLEESTQASELSMESADLDKNKSLSVIQNFIVDEEDEQSYIANDNFKIVIDNDELYENCSSKFNNSLPPTVFRALQRFHNQLTLIITTTNYNGDLFTFPIAELYSHIDKLNIWDSIKRILRTPNKRYLAIEFYNHIQMAKFKHTQKYLNNRVICYINMNKQVELEGKISNCYTDFQESDLSKIMERYGNIHGFRYLTEKGAGPAVLSNSGIFKLTLKQNIKPTDIPALYGDRYAPLIVTFRGIPPACFGCSLRGHVYKECPERKCNKCGLLKRPQHKCSTWIHTQQTKTDNPPTVMQKQPESIELANSDTDSDTLNQSVNSETINNNYDTQQPDLQQDTPMILECNSYEEVNINNDILQSKDLHPNSIPNEDDSMNTVQNHTDPQSKIISKSKHKKKIANQQRDNNTTILKKVKDNIEDSFRDKSLIKANKSDQSHSANAKQDNLYPDDTDIIPSNSKSSQQTPGKKSKTRQLLL